MRKSITVGRKELDSVAVELTALLTEVDEAIDAICVELSKDADEELGNAL